MRRWLLQDKAAVIHACSADEHLSLYKQLFAISNVIIVYMTLKKKASSGGNRNGQWCVLFAMQIVHTTDHFFFGQPSWGGRFSGQWCVPFALSSCTACAWTWPSIRTWRNQRSMMRAMMRAGAIRTSWMSFIRTWEDGNRAWVQYW